MSYKSLESIIKSVVLEESIQEAALGDHKGLQALAKRKTGEEKNVLMRAADMMRRGQTKDLNMFMKAMDQSTHKAMMPYVDKKHHKALHEDIEDLNEAEPTGLKIYHKDKSGKAGHAIVFTARDAQRRHNEIKKAGHTATHHALMYGTKEGPRKPIKEELNLDFLDEKKLTPAELKKREEIAKSIERDNPDMPMDKKMAIATATAKRVAEETKVIVEGGHEDVVSAKNQVKIAMAALQKMNGELDKLGEEDELPTWWTNKVAIAVDKLDGMADYLDTQVEACWDGYEQEDMKKKIAEVRGGADEPDKHIVMQLRKAQDVDGNHPITFRGGKKAKVSKKHIDKILKTHDHPSVKPVQKRMMRVAISKSPQHLANFADKLKEDYDTDNVDSVLNEAQKKQDMSQQMADKAKRDNISQSDKDKLAKLHRTMKNANEDTDDDGREVIHTRKADYKLAKVRLPSGKMVYRKVKKEISIEK